MSLSSERSWPSAEVPPSGLPEADRKRIAKYMESGEPIRIQRDMGDVQGHVLQIFENGMVRVGFRDPITDDDVEKNVDAWDLLSWQEDFQRASGEYPRGTHKSIESISVSPEDRQTIQSLYYDETPISVPLPDGGNASGTIKGMKTNADGEIRLLIDVWDQRDPLVRKEVFLSEQALINANPEYFRERDSAE